MGGAGRDSVTAKGAAAHEDESKARAPEGFAQHDFHIVQDRKSESASPHRRDPAGSKGEQGGTRCSLPFIATAYTVMVKPGMIELTKDCFVVRNREYPLNGSTEPGTGSAGPAVNGLIVNAMGSWTLFEGAGEKGEGDRKQPVH